MGVVNIMEYGFIFLVVPVLLGVGIALSAWKGEFGKNQHYCTRCSNPNHWSPEAREKEGYPKEGIIKEVIA